MLTLVTIVLAVIGSVAIGAAYLGWFQKNLTGSVDVKGIEAITIPAGYAGFPDYQSQTDSSVLDVNNAFVLSITDQNLLAEDVGENVSMLVDLNLTIAGIPVNLASFDISITGSYCQYKLLSGGAEEIRANNDVVPPADPFDVVYDGATVTLLELDRILYETPVEGQPTTEGNAVRFILVIDQLEPIDGFGPDESIDIELAITLGTE